MRLTLALALGLSLLLSLTAAAQEEPAPPEPELKQPGQAVIDRAKADAKLLLPQRGIGGSEKADLAGEPPEVKPYKVAFEGENADKLKAFVAAPTADKTQKRALVVAFQDNDDGTAKDLTRITALSQSRDPLVVCALQFRVLRKVDENFSISEYAAPKEVRMAALSRMLESVMKDYGVDPERVFLLSDYGSRDALEWAAELWKADADKFPFRAILANGTLDGDLEDMPPVPYVVSIESDFVAQLKGDMAEFLPHKPLNTMLARGIPCQLHICKSKNFSESTRWQFILRDAIQTLGGPGPRTYPDQVITVGTVTETDKVPFEESNDPYVSAVVSLAKEEQWSAAFKKLKDTLADKAIKSKEKKPLQDFQKKWDTYIKNEMERLNKSIEASIKAGMWCNSLHRARLAAMFEAFKDEKWAAGKPYKANLEKLETYPPAEREKARREKLNAAVKLELEGKRAEAKTAFAELAKQSKEDGGFSESARAAEYRISWWADLE